MAAKEREIPAQGRNWRSPRPPETPGEGRGERRRDGVDEARERERSVVWRWATKWVKAVQGARSMVRIAAGRMDAQVKVALPAIHCGQFRSTAGCVGSAGVTARWKMRGARRLGGRHTPRGALDDGHLGRSQLNSYSKASINLTYWLWTKGEEALH